MNGERLRVRVPAQLVGASVKLDRASAHLAELDDRIERFAASRPYLATVRSGNGGWQEVVVEIRREPDPGWSAVYGDAASSIRSALDYLVNELSILNGHPKRDAKFPVFQQATAFDKQSDSYLPGLHPEHVVALRKLQPFNDENPADHPLAQMAWISNRDKHRELQPAWVVPRESAHDLDLTLDIKEIEVAIHPGPITNAVVALAVRSAPPRQVLKRGRFFLDVGFGDLLLTRAHLRVAIGYTHWLLTRFQEAWGPVDWQVPDAVADARLASGLRESRGELVVVGLDARGQERTLVVPAVVKPFDARPDDF